MAKQYWDKDWLYEQYVILGKSTTTIAKEIGASDGAVAHMLRKHKIPLRRRSESKRLTASKKRPSKDLLIKLYQDEGRTLEEIAEQIGCSPTQINRYLRSYGIPLRERGSRPLKVKLLPECIEFLSGELLGDGYLHPLKKSASYQHASKYREYIEWISQTLASWGIEQSGQIQQINAQWSIVYRYSSRHYRALKDLRDRFYPNGRKIVPEDIELTPLTVRQWYIGDGCFAKPRKGHGRGNIIFATCSFDQRSIDILLAKMRDLGFRVSHWKASNSIGLSPYSIADFFNYIGPCPISCYQYKWPD